MNIWALVGGIVAQLWLLTRALLFGLLGALLGWILALASLSTLRSDRIAREIGTGQLYAVAGSWEFALQQPVVLFFLTICFGLGLWLHSRQQTWIMFVIAATCRLGLLLFPKR